MHKNEMHSTHEPWRIPVVSGTLFADFVAVVRIDRFSISKSCALLSSLIEPRSLVAGVGSSRGSGASDVVTVTKGTHNDDRRISRQGS